MSLDSDEWLASVAGIGVRGISVAITRVISVFAAVIVIAIAIATAKHWDDPVVFVRAMSKHFLTSFRGKN